MTTTRAKSKKAAPDICPKISNKISTRRAFSVVEATRQNVLEAFSLPSNCEKLSLVTTESTSLSLAGFLPVKVPLKRYTWVSSSVASILTKSPKIFNNRPVNKLAFPSIDPTLGASGTTSSKKIIKKTKNKISVASSGTLSKIGQDQLLAVLPNVVFSSRSLLVLEAKQSLPVGSPVLGNWADQMETDSSPPLVSETITSYQKFAGWVASTLVPGAIFKIKLAHVKTSLEAAFLVELTSSIHLATLKIAKSLVVFESGSSSAAVVLCNVPLGVSVADIKLAFSVFGSVTHVVLKPAGKDSVRILPLVNQNETILSHDKFKAKLVNLPPGCTTFEISDMISQIGDQTCFIPCSSDSGYCSQFALVIFDSQGDLDSAVVKTGTLRKCHIWWETPGCRHCFRCQKMGHLAVNYKIFSPFTLKVPKIFKSHFVGSVSYAKTAAPFGLSEFLPLVASSAASAANPAVSSRLDFLEKQISDLAALVKSIVKPIGSLVALVSCLLDDNAIKAV
ncbi:hypothetical protein G9A89_010996 [Geosiphon pyriformis]|nr:hypothetical protein G9A89_010996 [Geosiphon pyriformis]